MFSLGIRSNRSPESTIKECVHIFSKAKDSIIILGGDLKSGFYQNDRVIKSLKKATENKVTVQIALGNATLPRGKHKGIHSIKNVKIWQLKRPMERHQMSIDSRIARIEKRHGATATIHPAVLYLKAPLLAQKINRNFDEAEKTPIE